MPHEYEAKLTSFESMLVLKFAVKESLFCWKSIAGQQNEISAHHSLLA